MGRWKRNQEGKATMTNPQKLREPLDFQGAEWRSKYMTYGQTYYTLARRSIGGRKGVWFVLRQWGNNSFQVGIYTFQLNENNLRRTIWIYSEMYYHLENAKKDYFADALALLPPIGNEGVSTHKIPVDMGWNTNDNQNETEDSAVGQGALVPPSNPGLP